MNIAQTSVNLLILKFKDFETKLDLSIYKLKLVKRIFQDFEHILSVYPKKKILKLL